MPTPQAFDPVSRASVMSPGLELLLETPDLDFANQIHCRTIQICCSAIQTLLQLNSNNSSPMPAETFNRMFIISPEKVGSGNTSLTCLSSASAGGRKKVRQTAAKGDI